ncbi:hypothetical protein UA08_01008 [Talaromyces atroroseus]|uniref:Uncharacterized protein n=1 Tax=Talaromyces atroroseus TaxID=1441469 RepID=A0A225ARH8_TALAT|nr:hypothetical protein UA08_01008 [Talaromyces atroroseus]OKL64192.1 hypothetical protein UA08_01008 [Talaromyces atroroseus]
MAATRPDASQADQQSAAATPREPSSAPTRPAERCADASESTNSADTDFPLLYRPTVHGDTDIDIIWHNLYADSDFSVFRKRSEGPIERILTDFAGVVQAGVFEEVVSLSASKYMFTVTVVCSKQWDEVSKFVMSVL